MNESAQKTLDRITQKELHALLPSDIVFLRARSSYLTEEQKEFYQSILTKPSKEDGNEKKATHQKRRRRKTRKTN